MLSVNTVDNGTQVTHGRPAKQSCGTCVLQLQCCWCWSQVIQQCQLGLCLPPRGFLYSFAPLVLLPRKKLFIFPQKCLSMLESSFFAVEFGIGKMRYTQYATAQFNRRLQAQT